MRLIFYEGTPVLPGFFMQGMSMTESAVLFHFNPAGVILLVFLSGIVPSFAFGAGQRNSYSHQSHLP
jgi:hypothetical protein